ERGSGLAELRLDRGGQTAVPGLEQTSAEEELRRLVLELEPLDSGPRERGDLRREPIEDLGRDRVALRLHEDDSGQLGDSSQRDLLAVDRLGERARRV